MKMLRVVGTMVATLLVAASVHAQEAPPMPTEQHKWLDQLVGEWDTSSEVTFAPGMPPLKCEGKESVRKLGGFFTVSEQVGNFMGTEVKGVMTLGYDAEKKKYIGTWVDSMSSHMWHYVGTVDDAGKVLTLEAEGPNPLAEGKKAKFRDVITIKDKDHKVMTSSMLGEDGKWVTFMTANYTRKK
jgi:hypothetical protein